MTNDHYHMNASHEWFSECLLQITFSRSLDLKVHKRKTYSLLDWIGDVGGLLDGLYLIGEILVTGYSVSSLESYLASTLVWVRNSSQDDTLDSKSN